MKYTITEWKYVDSRQDEPTLETRWYIGRPDPDGGHDEYIRGDFKSLEDAKNYLNMYQEVLAHIGTKVVYDTESPESPTPDRMYTREDMINFADYAIKYSNNTLPADRLTYGQLLEKWLLDYKQTKDKA